MCTKRGNKSTFCKLIHILIILPIHTLYNNTYNIDILTSCISLIKQVHFQVSIISLFLLRGNTVKSADNFGAKEGDLYFSKDNY